MSNENPHHPHDGLFKAVFKDKKQLVEYLRFFLPDLYRKIDLDSLELDDTSYLDEVLRKTYSDIVYSCNYIEGGQKIVISLLLEHKSIPDKYVYFQLLEYMVRVWRHQRTNKEPLTIIIPIVLYHGKQNWNVRPFSSLFSEEFPEDLLAYLPRFEYILTDINDYSAEELIKIHLRFLLYSLFAMNKSGDKKIVREILFNIYRIRNLTQRHQLVKYIVKVTSYEADEVFD